MSLLGIDLGTSGCRVVAYSRDLVELAAATGDYREHAPGPGLVELDVGEVHRVVESAVRAVTAGMDDDPVTALAIACLGEAVVPWGADPAAPPLGPAPLSADRRGAGQLRRLVDRFGQDALRSRTGQPVHPMFSVATLAWWRENADWWIDVATITDVGGGLLRSWGVRPGYDYTLAARTQAFDAARRRWDPDILSAVDVPIGVLPEPVPVGTPLGTLPSAVAARLGLGAGVLAVAGAHDQACALWGAGLSRPGESVLSLGTTECLTTVHQGRPGGLIDGNVAAYPVDDAGHWITLAGIPAGGSTLLWLSGLGGGDPVARLDAVLADLPDGPAPALCLPHFLGSGTVENDPTSQGAFLGLSLRTTTADLALAVMESSGHEVAMTLRVLADGGTAGRGPIRVVGGGLRSARGLRARVDAAGVAMAPVTGHATARGAAMIAGVGCGVFTDLPDAAARIRPGPTLVPNPDRAEAHARRRAQFARLSAAARDVLDPIPSARPS